MSPHPSQVSFCEMDWEQVNSQIDKKPAFWPFLAKNGKIFCDFCQMFFLNIVGATYNQLCCIKTTKSNTISIFSFASTC